MKIRHPCILRDLNPPNMIRNKEFCNFHFFSEADTKPWRHSMPHIKLWFSYSMGQATQSHSVWSQKLQCGLIRPTHRLCAISFCIILYLFLEFSAFHQVYNSSSFNHTYHTVIVRANFMWCVFVCRHLVKYLDVSMKMFEFFFYFLCLVFFMIKSTFKLRMI